MDDYEIVPKEEVIFLKEEIKKLKRLLEKKKKEHASENTEGQEQEPEQTQENLPAPDQQQEQSPAQLTEPLNLDPTQLANFTTLQNSVQKLNESLSKLFMLFERAKSEIVTNKPEFYEADFRKVQTQNEKIASGIITIANMIKDQQIQINQLNTLYNQMSGQIREHLPKKRDYAFKIHPDLKKATMSQKYDNVQNLMKSVEKPKPEYNAPQPHTQHMSSSNGNISIDIPKTKPSQEILIEEKSQKFPSLNVFSEPEPEGNVPKPPVKTPNLYDVPDENIPPPPKPRQKFMDRFKK